MRFNKGFSLTELMVTVGTIGVLTAISVPVYQGYKAKSRRAECFTLGPAINMAAKTILAKFDNPPCQLTDQLTGSDDLRGQGYGSAQCARQHVPFPDTSVGLNDNDELYYSYYIHPTGGGGPSVNLSYPQDPVGNNNKFGAPVDNSMMTYANNTYLGRNVYIVWCTGKITKKNFNGDKIILPSRGKMFLVGDDITGKYNNNPDPM